LGSLDVTVRKTAVLLPPILARFWRDQGGVVAVAVAILLPVLIGFAGLGIEVGMWFWVQRQNQSAADAAAISAALEYAAQIEQPGITTSPTSAAATTANYNLFSTSAPNTLTVYSCYGFTVGGSCNTSSSNGTLPNAVQVVLTQPLNTTFAKLVTAIWGPTVNTVNVTTTAIAAFPSSGTACLLALDSAAANAVLIDNGTLQNPNCWVASNSTLGSALNCNSCTITGPTTVAGGDTVSNNGQFNGSPNRTYASAIADPYAATLTHAFLTAGMPKMPCSSTVSGPPGALTYSYSGICKILNILPGSTVILSPGTQIVSGLSASGTIILSPGPYWVTDGSLMLAGALTCQGCSPGSQGVTIIFTTMQGSGGTIGTLSPTGDLTITLNAPGAGRTYAGLLMVQDTVVPPTAGNPIGSPSATLSGLIYFPNANLSFVGNIRTDASNCLVAVAKRLSLMGNVDLKASGCPTAGPTTPPTILSVFLAV
jgi:Flp pilus assembly protein TadG